MPKVLILENNMEKIRILNDAGEIVDAVAPVIISASRSTDIPAYHSRWFMNRLNKGYCVWVNPFNQRKIYVSFSRARAIAFWTKNPKPMFDKIDELNKKNIAYYFQYTINDYENEGLEPGLKSLDCRIEDFIYLSEKIGKGRVVWRFDPILLCEKITPREILMRIWKIGQKLKKYTNKLVISFVDVSQYRRVKINLLKTGLYTDENVLLAEPNADQIIELCEGLEKIKLQWKRDGYDIEISTCCETVNLEKYGITKNRCIDDVLLRKEFSDPELNLFLGGDNKYQDELFGSQTIPIIPNIKIKDKSQRKECGCVQSKDIGMYNTCANFCRYCYANISEQVVKNNFKKMNDHSESIIGL